MDTETAVLANAGSAVSFFMPFSTLKVQMKLFLHQMLHQNDICSDFIFKSQKSIEILLAVSRNSAARAKISYKNRPFSTLKVQNGRFLYIRNSNTFNRFFIAA